MSDMQTLWSTSGLSGGNSGYLDELYETYLTNPEQLEQPWREYFASLPKVNGSAAADVSHSAIQAFFKDQAKQPRMAAATTPADAEHLRKQMHVQQFTNAYRSHGHRRAKLDPLALKELPQIPDLELNHHGLSPQDLDLIVETDFVGAPARLPLRELHKLLTQTYCGTIGVEYMHLSDPEELTWIQERLERCQSRPPFSAEQKKEIFKHLLKAEGLEKYLGNRFIGQKRFGLDGGESFIPMMSESIQRAGAAGVKEIVIGMAHRGRLNVLINTLGKAPKELFEEFEGKPGEEGFSGDVKYHKGFSSNVQTLGGPIHLALAFNPSHLEIVNPVVEGSVRARQDRRADQHRDQVVPLLVHGDAALTGQGVNMEMFNFSQVRGFATGGTIHIVINNQIGFTTSNPKDARSTLYCTDVTKMLDLPVFHVNTDDPEAAVFVTQLAIDYRMRFKKDIVIDLVCYRRLGHNESDEPSGTQPLMYHKIKNHPTTFKLYAQSLIEQGLYTQEEVDAAVLAYRDALDAGLPVVDILTGIDQQYISDWKPYIQSPWRQSVKTAVAKDKLVKIAKALFTLPEDLALQPQVAKVYEHRQKMMAGELPLDWGYVEAMTFGTLVEQGYTVRLSGQDSGRGTFSHRHAVLHDYNNGQVYIPLQHVSEGQAPFFIYDSVLSEEAVVAFEYGYASAEPLALTLWEAQYGDFANGAQVLFDQFVSSCEQKWGRLCGLTLLLPHGQEGAGPEHSSARLERFLQLCAQENMQVCVPTTPAQIFHLLRRQMLRMYRKPLIIMSPKSLLRHKLAVSTIDDLAQGEFQLVIPEIDPISAKEVKRLILCSGKAYYDLLEQRRASDRKDIAIVRIEQLYPFPESEVKEVLAQYPKAAQIVWCQEEHENQGSWYFVERYLRRYVTATQTLSYAGRAEAAAPAVGYAKLHAKLQKEMVEQALG